VAPGSSYCDWQEKRSPLGFFSRYSGLDFPAATLVAAVAPAFVVYVVTFQRLNNQHNHVTANLLHIFAAPFSGAYYGC
jgi:hypothetical protein